LANGDKVPIEGHGHVRIEVGTGKTKTGMGLDQALLVPFLAIMLLSVRAVDRKNSAVVFVRDACYILSDGSSVFKSGVLDKSSVVGNVNDQEQYVLKFMKDTASASAASARIAGKAALWHRRFNHLGIENLKRLVKIVDGMPSSVANAKQVLGTVCGSYIDGKMAQPPHPRSSSTTAL